MLTRSSTRNKRKHETKKSTFEIPHDTTCASLEISLQNACSVCKSKLEEKCNIGKNYPPKKIFITFLKEINMSRDEY